MPLLSTTQSSDEGATSRPTGKSARIKAAANMMGGTLEATTKGKAKGKGEGGGTARAPSVQTTANRISEGVGVLGSDVDFEMGMAGGDSGEVGGEAGFSLEELEGIYS